MIEIEEAAEELVAAARRYERLFVPSLFEVWTQHLIASAEIQQGSHVLDIACGTGVLARRALARAGLNGRVVGADVAPGMLAVAQQTEPRVEWLLSSAEALDLSDAEFDCVVCQFGMMFFEDKQKSTDEMYRVMKPGGTLSIAVWGSVEHNPAYADIISILEAQVGAAAADALRLPYSLGDASEVTALMERSGFNDIRIQTRTEFARFPSSQQMIEAELRGWLPLFDIFLTDAEISAILIESEQTLGRYASPSGEAISPTCAHIISAVKGLDLPKGDLESKKAS